MQKKKIIIEPDPILRQASEPLEKVDHELRKLMDDMLETMYSAPGIGLAAVQIGISKRLIVIDLSYDQKKSTLSYKLKLFLHQKTSIREEGCLSLPGHFITERPSSHINYIDYNGIKVLKVRAFMTCIQHKQII